MLHEIDFFYTNTYRVLSIVSVCDENVCSYFSSVILDDTNYTMRGRSTESKPSHAHFTPKKKSKTTTKNGDVETKRKRSWGLDASRP